MSAQRERFSARLSTSQKALLERAAALTDRTLTDFVLAAAQSEAVRVIQDHQVIQLESVAFDRFAEACFNEEATPDPKTQEAIAALRQRVRP
jgi:uncharacterized protein (DUF1778 family)